MNINAIASAGGYTPQLASASAERTRQAAPPPPPQQGAGFISAIGEALQSVGVSGSGSAGDGSNAAQALGGFLQQLMSALHAQGGGEAPPPGSAYGPPGAGGLQQDLQSLIASLNGDSTDSTSSLQASFSSLLSALGADSSDSNNQLSNFLQALSDNLPQAGSSGNLINISA